MNRGVPLSLVIVLIAAAVGATLAAERYFASQRPAPALTSAAAATPTPTPGATPTAQQTRSRDAREQRRVQMTAVIAAISGGRLVLRDITNARGVDVAQGARLTVQLDPNAEILREIAAADLRRGQRVALRAVVENGRVVVRQVIVER